MFTIGTEEFDMCGQDCLTRSPATRKSMQGCFKYYQVSIRDKQFDCMRIIRNPSITVTNRECDV